MPLSGFSIYNMPSPRGGEGAFALLCRSFAGFEVVEHFIVKLLVDLVFRAVDDIPRNDEHKRDDKHRKLDRQLAGGVDHLGGGVGFVRLNAGQNDRN